MIEPIKVTGTVYKVDEIKEYGQNGFRKHEVIVKAGDEKFPNPIKIEFTKDKIEESTQLSEGQEVEIDCHLNGAQWDKDGRTNFFLNLRGFNINVLSGHSVEPF